MKNNYYIITLYLALTTVLCISPSQADDNAKQGREILKKYKDSVIHIQMVLKEGASYGGRDFNKYELKTEVNGTIIDTTGLVVFSLSDVDINDSEANQYPYSDDEGRKYKSTKEIVNIKIIMPDSKEIPAKMVLRDMDLDLGFVKPIEKQKTSFVAIDLTNDSKPQVLDQLIILNRLGKVANRIPAVIPDQLEAIIEKPRKLYVPLQVSDKSELGTPVFTLDGKLVGILLERSIKTEMFPDSLRIILPPESIIEAIKQIQ